MAKKITDDGEIVDVVTHEVIARSPPMWKTPFNHDTDLESLASGTACRDPSKTQQQFAKDADINEILRKFMLGGDLPVHGSPVYQDAEEEFDLQNQIVTRHQVEEAWNALPAAVRNILRTPETFVRYIDECSRTGHYDELIELGLVDPGTPDTARVTTEEVQKPSAPPGGAPAPVDGKAPVAPNSAL